MLLEYQLELQKGQLSVRAERLLREEARLALPMCDDCGEHKEQVFPMAGQQFCYNCLTTGSARRKQEDAMLRKLGLI